MERTNTKQQRLDAANAFIQEIAGCGRRFFEHKGLVARLELSESGRVFFVDHYTQQRIYTHYCGRWKGFTGGGTLKSLIESLRDHVIKGHMLRANYFQPDQGNGFRNPWGYGNDILKVREAAVRLGLAK